MASINQRGGKLFFDYRWQGKRHREYTDLADYFPDSPHLEDSPPQRIATPAPTVAPAAMARLLRHYWTMLSKAPVRRFNTSHGSGLRTGPKRHTSKTPLVIIFSKIDNHKCLANLTFDQMDTTVTI
ncbi:MAG: hypothetical protein V7746_18850 [Halioglobus sp.]